jgi:hypothetical protein
MVLTKEFTEDGVICVFKQKWDGNVAEINYMLFNSNGYYKE